jgi:hypothetical protein
MDKEERKQYNKVYYSLHRERILSYLCEKVSCDYCGRCVIKNNLVKHQKSDICKRHRERLLELNKWNSLLEMHPAIVSPEVVAGEVTIKD